MVKVEVTRTCHCDSCGKAIPNDLCAVFTIAGDKREALTIKSESLRHLSDNARFLCSWGCVLSDLARPEARDVKPNLLNKHFGNPF